jgi:peptidoglycan/xylan/chitin deacetylase (PgdA/CDA1 family)
MTIRMRESPEYLRFLARWDRDESVLRDAMEELAGRPVVFSGARRHDRRALFGPFSRDPLDAVTQREDGSWELPYHPWAAYREIVEERYLGPPKPPLHARIPLPYHWVPGPLRLALYPLIAGRNKIDPEASPPDPAWPVEDRVDKFRARLFEGIAEHNPVVSGQFETATPPRRGPWPGGHRFALLVTHDVDTKEGMALAGDVLEDMLELGLKPCFFLVGKTYTWDEGFIRAVRDAGGEIGLHGDTHDNRIAYDKKTVAERRLDSCRDLIQKHGIRGFRSPSLLVSDTLYEALNGRFDWDSSVPDTDTHTLLGPRRGCGTIFPFRRNGMLVLPTTMPADDRLQLLGYRGLDVPRILLRKYEHTRLMCGLCHFLTHPEPHLLGKPVIRDLFRSVLKEIVDRGDAWIATPSEVADYWTTLEAGVVGDAA